MTYIDCLFSHIGLGWVCSKCQHLLMLVQLCFCTMTGSPMSVASTILRQIKRDDPTCRPATDVELQDIDCYIAIPALNKQLR